MQLTCPKCHGDMRQYERSGITIDQCTECRGIFLDRGELEKLYEVEAAWASSGSGPSAAPPPPTAPAPPPGPAVPPEVSYGQGSYGPGYGAPGGSYGAPPPEYHGHYRYRGHYRQRRRRGFLHDLFD
jgi:Zn-finger nucleic acid-binding protein